MISNESAPQSCGPGRGSRRVAPSPGWCRTRSTSAAVSAGVAADRDHPALGSSAAAWACPSPPAPACISCPAGRSSCPASAPVMAPTPRSWLACRCCRSSTCTATRYATTSTAPTQTRRAAKHDPDRAGASLLGAPGLQGLQVERRHDGSPYLTRLRDVPWRRPVEKTATGVGADARWTVGSLDPNGARGTPDDIVVTSSGP
jgi:hypothetical protein